MCIRMGSLVFLAPLLPPESGFIGLLCRPFIRSLSKHLCSEPWLSGLLRGAGPRPVGRQDSHHVGGGVARRALGASAGLPAGEGLPGPDSVRALPEGLGCIPGRGAG